MKRLMYVLAIALAALAAQAQVYKWVDKEGRTHYGEKPPEGVKATPMGAPPPGPSGADQSWKDKDIQFRQRQLKRDEQERAGQDSESQRAQREQNCAIAKKRLEILDAQAPVFTRDEKGERTYLDDKAREAEKAIERKAIAENCGR